VIDEELWKLMELDIVIRGDQDEHPFGSRQ